MEKLILTMGISAILTLVQGPIAIPMLQRLKFGQSIRDEGPQRHLQKAGTPTMGGIMFLLALTVATLVVVPTSPAILLMVGTTIAYGILGFLDDFIKVVMKRNLGLRAKQKLVGQIAISAVLAYVAAFVLNLGTGISIPFTSYVLDWGWWFYLVFVLIVTVGTTNAVNLTDGLDGLATGITIVTSLAFGVVALVKNDLQSAIFAGAVAGSLMGFLAFNLHPARVFMGDTGSLALGGALAAIAVVTKTELLLPIIGGVYVVETLSVIIQVISFKTTGRRVFRMSPLHHHFELLGWSEGKVVKSFWLAALVCSVVGVTAVLSMS